MNKREELLKTAFTVFSEKGYAMTLNDIANANGLKKQSIYNYFNSKDEIIKEVIYREINDISERVNTEISKLNQLTYIEQLRFIFMYIYINYKSVDRINFWKRILLETNEPEGKKVKSLIREKETYFIEVIKNIFDKGCEVGDFTIKDKETALNMYKVMIHGIIDIIAVSSGTSKETDSKVNKLFDFYESMLTK